MTQNEILNGVIEQLTALQGVVAELAAATYSEAPTAAPEPAKAPRERKNTADAGKPRVYRFSPAYPGMPLHRGKPHVGRRFRATSSGNTFRVIGVENGRVLAEKV